MAQLRKEFLLLFLVSLLSVSLMAQTAPAKNKKEIEAKKQQAYKADTTRFTPPKIVKESNSKDIPPPVEAMDNVPIPADPMIDFDTTAAPDDAFTRDIKTLLKLMGALETDVAVAEKTLKTTLGDGDNELIKEFSSRFINEMRNGRSKRWLENLYIRSYRSAYTQKEIGELIQFYGTPLGKKVVSTLPALMSSVMENSQKIGRYIGQKLMNEIQAEKK
ncbi:MAG TPA: DUF2059 domain-containing protein [Chitinophagaceae bacterium]|jgi:hypothetical protein|nr:DUF2059 domain-containing protein [Chitinophagaceae bacterium]